MRKYDIYSFMMTIEKISYANTNITLDQLDNVFIKRFIE